MSARLNAPTVLARGNYPLYRMSSMLGEHQRLSGCSGEEIDLLPYQESRHVSSVVQSSFNRSTDCVVPAPGIMCIVLHNVRGTGHINRTCLNACSYAYITNVHDNVLLNI
jgi:hypothetical protein